MVTDMMRVDVDEASWCFSRCDVSAGMCVGADVVRASFPVAALRSQFIIWVLCT